MQLREGVTLQQTLHPVSINSCYVLLPPSSRLASLVCFPLPRLLPPLFVFPSSRATRR